MGGDVTSLFKHHGRDTGLSFTIRGVANVSLDLVNLAIEGLLSSWVLVIEWGQLLSSALVTWAVINQIFDGLLVVAANFHLIQRRINHLSVDSLEFTVVAEIDLHVLVLG